MPVSTAKYDLVVVGAGPAGSAAAIRAAQAGMQVLLLERGRYPRNKVCGEFVSPKGVAALQQLDPAVADRLLGSALSITRARLFIDGCTIQVPIEPRAVSITRSALDQALWQAAGDHAAECLEQTSVEAVSPGFMVKTSAGVIPAKAVIVATGRWSNLRRTPESNGEKWVGLKAHYRESQPANSVDLYFFRGGYCGAQPIATDLVNVCALVNARHARSLDEVFQLDSELRARSCGWSRADEVVSTSPLIFNDPLAEREGILHAGDAAAFIDPFVGDGISIALCSGVMAAECLEPFWRGEQQLSAAAATYRMRYEQELLPLFRNACLLRRLLSLPRPVRNPLLAVLRVAPITRWLVHRTRAVAWNPQRHP